jgi:hypothetical protein
MILLCPCCGAGLATRRGLRLHLVSHGYDWEGTLAQSSDIMRTHAPAVWRCKLKSCRRTFATVRGLCLHGRASGHGGFPLKLLASSPAEAVVAG